LTGGGGRALPAWLKEEKRLEKRPCLPACWQAMEEGCAFVPAGQHAVPSSAGRP